MGASRVVDADTRDGLVRLENPLTDEISDLQAV